MIPKAETNMTLIDPLYNFENEQTSKYSVKFFTKFVNLINHNPMLVCLPVFKNTL